MTSKELIDRLKRFPPNLPVIFCDDKGARREITVVNYEHEDSALRNYTGRIELRAAKVDRLSRQALSVTGPPKLHLPRSAFR